MEKTISTVKLFIAFIGGIFATAIGGFDKLAILIFCLTFSDVLFGSAKGIKKKNFSSSILFWGLVNKAVIFIIIALMVLVDNVLGKVGFLRNAFIIWFSLCEAASILENTAALGIPYPDWFLNTLIQVKKGFSINLGKIVARIIEDFKIPEGSQGDDKNAG